MEGVAVEVVRVEEEKERGGTKQQVALSRAVQ